LRLVQDGTNTLLQVDPTGAGNGASFATVLVLQNTTATAFTSENFNPGFQPDGVLIFGSGFLTHNMRYAFRPGIPDWAREFDEWAGRSIAAFDVDALIDFHTRAPAAHTALPTWEHYAPLLVSAGAASENNPGVSFPITGFWTCPGGHVLEVETDLIAVRR
jgi:hypothetical protein